MLILGRGGLRSGGYGNCAVFACPRAAVPRRRAPPATTQASARHGGGRGLWPPAGVGCAAQRLPGAMPFAGPRRSPDAECPFFPPAIRAFGTFSQPAKVTPARRPAGVSRAAAVAGAVEGDGPRCDRQGPQGRSGVCAARGRGTAVPARAGVFAASPARAFARNMRRAAFRSGPQGWGKAGSGRPVLTFPRRPRLAAGRQRAYQTPVGNGACHVRRGFRTG